MFCWWWWSWDGRVGVESDSVGGRVWVGSVCSGVSFFGLVEFGEICWRVGVYVFVFIFGVFGIWFGCLGE